MGLSITATNSKYNFSLGYGSFARLRCIIAKAYDEELGKAYKDYMFEYNHEDESIASLNKVLIKFNENDEILNFLFESDCDGKINYRTCKKIYDLIKDVNLNNIIFQYVGCQLQGISDFEAFKLFLKECYKYRRNMIWR